MKLKVLVDNNTYIDQYYCGEPAVSYYIEDEDNCKKNISIIAHPDAFNEKKFDDLKICSPILQEELKEKFNLILSKNPIKVSKNITFLGEIPQTNDFENRRSIGTQIVNGNSVDDYVMDDTALVYKNENGIYIITGCSHSGICNII